MTHVTPLLVARSNGRRVSTARKTALANCRALAGDCLNQPSLVTLTMKSTSGWTNFRNRSGTVSSKQITTAKRAVGRSNRVNSWPRSKLLSPIGVSHFMNGNILRHGTYSPNGTRCILWYITGTDPSGRTTTAPLKTTGGELWGVTSSVPVSNGALARSVRFVTTAYDSESYSKGSGVALSGQRIRSGGGCAPSACSV